MFINPDVRISWSNITGYVLKQNSPESTMSMYNVTQTCPPVSITVKISLKDFQARKSRKTIYLRQPYIFNPNLVMAIVRSQ